MMRIGYNPYSYSSSNTSFSGIKDKARSTVRAAINEELQDALDKGLVKTLKGKVVNGGKVAK